MRSEPQIPPLTKQRQAQASEPRLSAWVSANAGSGKTYVLVNRVLRLLLDDVAPGRLLCITYTKAAAANMANRLFRELSAWATLPEESLRKALAALTGSIGQEVKGYGAFSRVPAEAMGNVRNDMYLTSEAIRLIKQGAVRFAGERLEDPKTVLAPGTKGVLQVGKRRIAKVRID